MEFNTKRTERSYSDEQIEKLEHLIDEHNVGKSWTSFYYIIDVTGSKQVYFTLYRYSQPAASAGFMNPYKYVKNISIDIEKAVLSMLKKSMPILFITTGNNNPLISGFRKRTKEGIPLIPIGKYKGETLESVWETDRNWVMWFRKNYKSQTYINHRGNLAMSKLTIEDCMLLEQANNLAEVFWTEWREKENEKNALIETNYIGEIGKRIKKMSVTIEKIKQTEEYVLVTAIDENGNYLYWYNKNNGIDVDSTIIIAGTPKKHLEKLSLKMTYVNRVKILENC